MQNSSAFHRFMSLIRWLKITSQIIDKYLRDRGKGNRVTGGGDLPIYLIKYNNKLGID